MRWIVAALISVLAVGTAHAAECAAYGETTFHTDITADGPKIVAFTPCLKAAATPASENDAIQAYGLSWKPHKVTEQEAAAVVIYVDRMIRDTSAKFATARSAISDQGDVVVCGYVRLAALQVLYAVNFTPEGVVQHTNLEGEDKYPTIARETCSNVGALPVASAINEAQDAGATAAMAADALPAAEDLGPPLPIYDVDGSCQKGSAQKNSAYPSPPEQWRLGCVQVEQQAYDELRAIWDGLMPETRRKAIAGADRVGGTYRYSNLKGLALLWARHDEAIAAQESAKQGFKP